MAGIFPRSVIGTPEPPASRRKLVRVGVLLAHEVGVNTPATGRYRSSDSARVLDDAKAAAAYGVSAGKAWEYSFMIGLDGSVFTQAGEYMAAHCLNFNTLSAGVIFLNALDVPANAAQVDAWWQLRQYMVDVNILSVAHIVAPHYRYRATSCPGLRAEPPGGPWNSPTGEGRQGSLIPALTIAPPIPPPEDDEDMALICYIATPPSERPGAPWLFVYNGNVRYCTSHDTTVVTDQRPLNTEQYDYLRQCAGV